MIDDIEVGHVEGLATIKKWALVAESLQPVASTITLTEGYRGRTQGVPGFRPGTTGANFGKGHSRIGGSEDNRQRSNSAGSVERTPL